MNIIHLEEIDSTNAYVKSHISELEDMTVVYTPHQTNGRGRLERKWVDTGSENIYMTFCLKPFETFNPIYANISQYLSLVLCKTLENYGIDAKIKWPNDVLVDGKKIAGILSESTMKGQVFTGLALGIGINLNTPQEVIDKIDQPATSLNLLLNKKIDREKFLHDLLDKFCLGYNDFIKEGFLLIREDYLKRAGFINKTVTVRVLETEIQGIAQDITVLGELKLLDKENKEHILYIGDIL